jgi:hypothetical protein
MFQSRLFLLSLIPICQVAITQVQAADLYIPDRRSAAVTDDAVYQADSATPQPAPDPSPAKPATKARDRNKDQWSSQFAASAPDTGHSDAGQAASASRIAPASAALPGQQPGAPTGAASDGAVTPTIGTATSSDHSHADAGKAASGTAPAQPEAIAALPQSSSRQAGTSDQSATSGASASASAGSSDGKTPPAATAGQSAERDGKIKIGELACDVSSGIGLIIGSSRKLDCTFNRPGQPEQRYKGEMNLLGLDVGVITKSRSKWDVLADPGTDLGSVVLDGTFTGASASATAGGTISSKTLSSGTQKGIVLSPAADAGQRGVDVSAGITSINLSRING